MNDTHQAGQAWWTVELGSQEHEVAGSLRQAMEVKSGMKDPREKMLERGLYEVWDAEELDRVLIIGIESKMRKRGYK